MTSEKEALRSLFAKFCRERDIDRDTEEMLWVTAYQCGRIQGSFDMRDALVDKLMAKKQEAV